MANHATVSDIHPCLTYADAPAAIDWLCRVFGFTKRLIVHGPGDSIRHSELSLGTGVVMVSSARDGRAGPAQAGGFRSSMSVCVPDPDAHFARSLAAGAAITQPIRDEEYGARGYAVVDLEGHEWYFGNYRPGMYWSDSGVAEHQA